VVALLDRSLHSGFSLLGGSHYETIRKGTRELASERLLLKYQIILQVKRPSFLGGVFFEDLQISERHPVLLSSRKDVPISVIFIEHYKIEDI
jgi:hypothetical protein